MSDKPRKRPPDIDVHRISKGRPTHVDGLILCSTCRVYKPRDAYYPRNTMRTCKVCFEALQHYQAMRHGKIPIPRKRNRAARYAYPTREDLMPDVTPALEKARAVLAAQPEELKWVRPTPRPRHPPHR